MNLPTFDKPPVGEVVLSIQFPRLSRLQAAHVGRFWQEVQPEFPGTETHPTVDAVVERFERPASPAKVRFQFRPADVMPRVWLISADNSRLIQIQGDRFICNWRRSGSNHAYPRYPEIRQFFEQQWNRWYAFLLQHGLTDGDVEVEQCEVTYTNHIAMDGVWSDYTQAPKVLRLIAAPPHLAHALKGEFTSLSTHYLLEHQSDQQHPRPIGRLHIDFDPGIDAVSGKPIFILNLVARGLISRQWADVLPFFDLARSVIVTSFRDITTSAMHRVWKLKEES